VSLNVSTACHFNTCIAVRVNEAFEVLSGSGISVNVTSLEAALKFSGLGKRSKQRFLKSSSRDDAIKKRTRGAGGNTNTFICHIIKQSAIPDDIELLAKG